MKAKSSVFSLYPQVECPTTALTSIVHFDGFAAPFDGVSLRSLNTVDNMPEWNNVKQHSSLMAALFETHRMILAMSSNIACPWRTQSCNKHPKSLFPAKTGYT